MTMLFHQKVNSETALMWEKKPCRDCRRAGTPKKTISNYTKNRGIIVSTYEVLHHKDQMNDCKGTHSKLEDALKLDSTKQS